MRFDDQQVKQFILHADQDVRQEAIKYFSGAYSDDPEVMPLAIRAIEQFGPEQAFQFYYFPSELAQTDATLTWLIDQVRQSAKYPSDERWGIYWLNLCRGLARADTRLLEPRLGEIRELERFDESEWLAIQQRLALLDRTADDLWEELQAASRGLDARNDYLGFRDLDVGHHLVEALTRHPDFAASKVLPILRDDEQFESWLFLFVVRLAGELRLSEAIPWLVPLLSKADDWMMPACIRALVRIGDDAIVDQLVRSYPESDGGFRLVTGNILERIHSEAGLAAAIELLANECDQDTGIWLCHAALASFSSKAIEPVRAYLATCQLDPEVVGAREHLLTVCKALGETFPDYDRWVEQATLDRESLADLAQKRYPLLAEIARMLEHLQEAGLKASDDVVDEGDDFEPHEKKPLPIARNTIVREQARFGRNDPCPCGSGKKFKKCCLRKESLSS